MTHSMRVEEEYLGVKDKRGNVEDHRSHRHGREGIVVGDGEKLELRGRPWEAERKSNRKPKQVHERTTHGS